MGAKERFWSQIFLSLTQPRSRWLEFSNLGNGLGRGANMQEDIVSLYAIDNIFGGDHYLFALTFVTSICGGLFGTGDLRRSKYNP